MLPLTAPLDPSGDDARTQLARELAHWDYLVRHNWLLAILQWLWNSLRGRGGGGTWQQLGTVVGALIVIGLVALIARWVWNASKAPSGTDGTPTASGLVESGVSSADYRRRAEAALLGGDHDLAVADAFRSIVVDLDSRGVLGDTPARTAHEAAALIALALPSFGQEAGSAGSWFDLAVYGVAAPPRTTAGQARAVLDLGLQMAQAKPEAPPAHGPHAGIPALPAGGAR